MVMDSWTGLLVLLPLAAYAAVGAWRLYRRFFLRGYVEKLSIQQAEKDSTSLGEYGEYSFYNIVSLPDFEWEKTEPLKYRPFKPKFHLTMGLTNSSLSELVEMDKNYLSRVNLRKQIMLEHHSNVIQAAPSIKPAVDELYTWLVSTYLPTRFPKMFTLCPSTSSLLNHATSQHLQLTAPSDPIKTFEILGGNLEDDILLLLPSDDGDGYVLRGFVTCFPSGFNTKLKFGQKLRDIHGPVPGYKEKLEKSMDRFFDRLEVGNVVRRVNWSIANDQLYSITGNHLYEGEKASEENVDINKTYLRCERQTLHRLPKTKALVFSFKTYLYPLRDIKNEGLGEDFAQAIDGLKEGSVPAMHFYKRGVVWGEAVKAYLRN